MNQFIIIVFAIEYRLFQNYIPSIIPKLITRLKGETFIISTPHTRNFFHIGRLETYNRIAILTLRDAEAGTVTMAGTSPLSPLILPLYTAHHPIQRRHIGSLLTEEIIQSEHACNLDNSISRGEYFVKKETGTPSITDYLTVCKGK